MALIDEALGTMAERGVTAFTLEGRSDSPKPGRTLQNVAEPFGSVAESSGSVAESFGSTRESSESVAEPLGSVAEPSGSTRETFGSTRESSNQGRELFGSTGEVSGGVIEMEDAALLEALREVAPPSLAFLLDDDGTVSFPYASPWGTVSIVAQRSGGETRAFVSPARHASQNVGGPPISFPAPPPDLPAPAPPPPGEAPELAVFDAAFRPAPSAAKSAAKSAAPAVGCLPAAGLSFACVVAAATLNRVLGDEAGLLLVVASSVAVFFDATRLGARRGKLSGVADMGPWGWFLACLLIWGVGMPYYLLSRPHLARIKEEEDARRPPWA